MTRARTLRIGTRGSQLALWQANTVAGLLNAAGVRTELVTIRTGGDRLQEVPVAAATTPPADGGSKRLFVKEIEDALLRGDVDLAVHSAKDMPAVLPDGLTVAATLPREDPRDAIVLPAGAPSGTLPEVLPHVDEAPVIGTSSVRRIAQLLAVFPGGAFQPIRGNVDTRLRKLDSGEFNVLVLASAGMRRLGVGARISAPVPVDVCVPAPGQGIVAIEIRSKDDEVRTVLAAVDDEAAGQALTAERTLVAVLGGGCQLPLGALAVHDDGSLDMHGIVVSPDGARTVKARVRGPASDPAALGIRLADELARGGARKILDEVRR